MHPVRVLSIALNPPLETDDRVETNLELILNLLDCAAAYDPDVVCFPEYVVQLRYRGDGLEEADVTQSVPGPATDAVAEKAATLDSYVLLPLLERRGDSFFNAAVLLDRDGEVVGTARKVAPTMGEMRRGTVPGDDVAVWDTDVGRIGVFICWDGRYPDVAVRLAQRRADIVLHPTTSKSVGLLEGWAKQFGYHVIVCDKDDAKTIAPTGATLGAVSGRSGNPTLELDGGATARLSFAVLNTDCGTFGRYQNRFKIREALAAHAGSLVYHELADVGNVVLESIDETVRVERVADEYDLRRMFEYEEDTRARIHDVLDDSSLLPAREE